MELPLLLMCILIHLSSLIRNGENRVINGKPLHHLMTREEIKQFFGEDELSSVPEYDVALPFEANEGRSFVTYSLDYRSKRSLPEDENGNAIPHRYIINALGEKLDLRVKRNTNFMAPGLQLETRDEKGRRITKPVSRKSFVTGKLASDPDSMVALSVTDGLKGIVRRSRDTFLIHPLPTRLARHFASKEGTKPHLVHRISRQEGIECQTKPVTAKREVSPSESKRQLKDESRDVTNKYLQVALLADEQIVAVHGNNTEEFLLLIGSVTDRIFQDATIGDIKINYVITRLVLITNDELGVDPSNPGISHSTVLSKVAKWARDNNRDNESDPLQFDVAVLIRSGKTGALAVFGGICHNDDIVSVVGENGLQTAYTIAHETAHNLGVGHDSEGNNACPNHVNLMSTVLQGGPGSVEWSSCSMEKIQNFLMSIDSVCLNDTPSSSRPMPPASFYTKLPGEIADADTQCEHQYGPGYKRCSQTESNCGSLYCTANGYNCYSRASRPLDGTACGVRSWCIKGYCVDNGSPMINGGWSEWSDYTPCTKSCEGGVRNRERTCTNPPPQNGGESCEGPSKAFWEICNSNVMCDLSEPSFRDQQCTQINSNYTALSTSRYPQNKNPCKLACRLGNAFWFHGNVIDGTRCSTDDRYVYDVCIQGQCQAVGCDHILHSGKVKDRCGICDGNGDSCTLVQSSYTENCRTYCTIAILPVNTSNAVFQQRNVKQYNVIGIQDENGKYLIKLPTWSKKVIYNAGTKIYYNNGYENPDRLEIDGPTNMTLEIEYVYFQLPNVGVDYRYYRQLESNEIPEPLTCNWTTSDWTDCSTGQQTRDVLCVRSDDLSPASADCCGEDLKPNAVNLCFGWHTSGWQSCTKTCGRGSQSRTVVCRAKINDTHYQIESDSVCDATPKPIEQRYCNEIQCPANRTTHWTQCSSVCLPGERTNYTTCSRTNELGENEEVSDIQCGYEPKPPSVTEPCNHDNPCKEHVIGCFKTPDGLFPETLGDFTQEADSDQALMECGELAHNQGYQVFALGFGGLCLSGPNAQDNYYTYRQPTKKDKDKCSNGIGMGPRSVVYSFAPLPEFEPVGCYKDNLNDRALPDHYANFRPFIDWDNMDATIRQCALVARDIGYEYFAVQFYGECWSSFDAANNYNRHGVQTNPDMCWANVGAQSTNFVYQFSQVLT